MSALTWRRAETPEGPLRWLEGGVAEGPAIGFVHGNSASPEALRPLLDSRLARRFRLCALELPGHGGSVGGDPSRFTVEGLRTALERWLELAGLAGGIGVGHSLGGHLWMQLGAERLATLSGVFVYGAPPMRDVGEMGSGFAAHPAAALLGVGQLTAAQVHTWAQACVSPTTCAPDFRIADIVRTDVRFRPAMLTSAPTQWRDERAALRDCGVAVALAHGGDDAFVRLDHLRGVEVPRLWRGEVAVLPGAGHCPHRTRTEALAALLEAFVDDVLAVDPRPPRAPG